MPLIRLNAEGSKLSLHNSPGPWRPCLNRAAKGTGPIIIMTHGFKYAPGRDLTCPHTRIFSTGITPTSAKSTLWLPPLGFGAGDGDEGLAVAFGWDACGTVWTARKSAIAAGHKLADIITQILRVAVDRPIHLIAHSMGSEVVLKALGHLPRASVTRIVLLTGASYQSDATAALKTAAGQSAEVINVISRENDVFDFLFEQTIAAPKPGDHTIGSGIHAPNAINIQLDSIGTLHHLNALGASIAPPTRRICHWSSYTRPGVLQFYASLLRNPGKYPLKTLKQALPDQPSPRWSNLLKLPHLPTAPDRTREANP